MKINFQILSANLKFSTTSTQVQGAQKQDATRHYVMTS